MWLAPQPQKLYENTEKATADDQLLYLTEIYRIHQGENYYRVAADELVAQGFPTRSVFNWRTPLLLWILAELPSLTEGRLILIGAGILTLFLSLQAAVKDEPHFVRFALPLVLLLTSPVLQCAFGNTFVMTEVWAGMAIAMSIAAYGLDLWLLAVAMGLFGLFVRELSIPYCAVCLLFSIWQRRRTETVIWLTGLTAWLIYFTFHCSTVTSLIDPHAVAPRRGWIQFGGLAFVLGTVQVNYFLLTFPMPVSVAYLSMALFGLVGWTSRWGQLIVLTVCAYLGAFSIVGQDFNRYWGFMTVPLLCYGVARAPTSILDAIKAAKLWPLRRSAKSEERA